MKVLYAAGVAAFLAFSAPALAADTAPAPLDPQNWSWQDELTWNDYKKLPGPDYSDPSIQPTVKKWKVALVVTDFPGTPLAITQPENGTVFGTPTAQAHDVPRAQAAQWYADFLNKPQALNNFQTMNRYWMEDSFGKYGVQLDAFGPYQLPGTQYQYFVGDQSAANRTEHCPNVTPARPCTLNFRTDARAAWEAAVGAAKIAEYDNIFYVSAGEDESSTWQEFGEMKWMTQEEVPDAFGPKAIDPLQTNWAFTRYVPWTSWVSAATNWPNAQGNTSVEAESSGMSTYAHELSHNLVDPRQLRQPVRRHAAARLHRHVGHDEPRHVQRPGRPAHALPDPADAGLLARLAAQHPQQALPELRRRQRPGAAQPQRARVLGHGGRRRHRA